MNDESKLTSDATRRPFAEDTSSGRRVQFSWRRTLSMCAASVRNRKGRFMLTVLSVAVVVAFLTSVLAVGRVQSRLLARPASHPAYLHTKAVLERTGTFSADPAAIQKRQDRRLWVVGLSLILCVVGITNAMLMTVTERAREIGTLKCLGALDRYVVRLFLIESLLVGLVASALGAGAGYVLGLLQVGLTLEFALMSGGDCLAAFTASVPLSIAIGAGLTVVSALYPTWVASHMRPVEAMRVEM